MHVYTHTHIYICMRTHMYIYTHIHMCVCVCVCCSSTLPRPRWLKPPVFCTIYFCSSVPCVRYWKDILSCHFSASLSVTYHYASDVIWPCQSDSDLVAELSSLPRGRLCLSFQPSAAPSSRPMPITTLRLYLPTARSVDCPGTLGQMSHHGEVVMKV